MSLPLSLLNPWWLAVLPSFFLSLIKADCAKNAFLSGSLGMSAAWLSIIFYYSYNNEFILVKRIYQYFYLPNPFTLFVVITIIAGLLGGLAALAGFYTKNLFINKPVGH